MIFVNAREIFNITLFQDQRQNNLKEMNVLCTLNTHRQEKNLHWVVEFAEMHIHFRDED